MTPNETTALLAYMSSAWPAVEITEDTARMWAKQLANLHPDDGLAVADLLIRESKWFPSVAEFIDASRPLSRRRREIAAVAELESSESRLPDEEQAAQIRDWLESFKARDVRTLAKGKT